MSEEDGPIYKRFPEEHDTAQLVRDNGYIMSYFSGVELSVLNTDKSSQCYPLWQTELFPIGVDNDTNTAPELAKRIVGRDDIGRTAPSLLNKDTMFYSYSDFGKEVSSSCIWRATGVGNDKDKVWTEDANPVTCTTANDQVNIGAPYSIDVAAFYDKENQPWLVYGSHFSGIFLVKLDENDTSKVEGANGYEFSKN